MDRKLVGEAWHGIHRLHERKSTMLKVFITGASIVTAASWVQASDDSSSKTQCLDGRQAALKAGDFSGPLLCEGEHAAFKLAGTIRITKQTYLVYDYRYRFMPEHGNVLHGGQRVVIFSSDDKYLGQYALSPPPPLDVMVSGTSIVISVGGQSKGVIDFKDGPPLSALVDGLIVEFFK